MHEELNSERHKNNEIESLRNSHELLTQKYKQAMSEKIILEVNYHEVSFNLKQMNQKVEQMTTLIEFSKEENRKLKNENVKLVENNLENEKILENNEKEFHIDLKMIKKLHKKLNKRKQTICCQNEKITYFEKMENLNKFTTQNLKKQMKEQD